MRGQRRRQMKVGKDHPRAAVPGFLPVEFDLHRNALAHLDDVGAVSTADRYLDPLHPVADRGGVGAAGRKEVPRQPGDRQGRAYQDGNVNAGHHELLASRDLLGVALWTALRTGLPRELVHAGLVRLGVDLPRQPLSDDDRLRDQGPTPPETRIHVRRQ